MFNASTQETEANKSLTSGLACSTELCSSIARTTQRNYLKKQNQNKQNIILNEGPQTQKDKCHLFFLMCGS